MVKIKVGMTAYCANGSVKIVADGIALPGSPGVVGFAGICDNSPDVIRYWFDDGDIDYFGTTKPDDFYRWRLSEHPKKPNGMFSAGHKKGEPLISVSDAAAIRLAEKEGYRFFGFDATGEATPMLVNPKPEPGNAGRERIYRTQCEKELAFSSLMNAVVCVSHHKGRVTQFRLIASREDLPVRLSDSRVPSVTTHLFRLSPFKAPECIGLEAARKLFDGGNV